MRCGLPNDIIPPPLFPRAPLTFPADYRCFGTCGAGGGEYWEHWGDTYEGHPPRTATEYDEQRRAYYAAHTEEEEEESLNNRLAAACRESGCEHTGGCEEPLKRPPLDHGEEVKYCDQCDDPRCVHFNECEMRLCVKDVRSDDGRDVMGKYMKLHRL